MNVQKATASLLTGLLILLSDPGTARADAALDKYQKYIVHREDDRSALEGLLNRVGITLSEIGPAYALIAGIDNYPKLRGHPRELRAAAVDIDKLVTYLRDHEHFSQIVVLRNEAVTLENLDYFLQRYFPSLLEAVPKSRFLFAYSGHGIQEGDLGFLLRQDAEQFDADFGISLNVIKGLYDRVLRSAHQSLVLINACHAGAFLQRESFGRVVPRQPGHWAITAGGDASELVWHDRRIGPGSIFFEKFFAGLEGRADQTPENADGTFGDGLVTVEELFSYLKTEIQLATNQTQNPRLGNISAHGDHGSFFFVNQHSQITTVNEPEFEVASSEIAPMGSDLERPLARQPEIAAAASWQASESIKLNTGLMGWRGVNGRENDTVALWTNTATRESFLLFLLEQSRAGIPDVVDLVVDQTASESVRCILVDDETKSVKVYKYTVLPFGYISLRCDLSSQEARAIIGANRLELTLKNRNGSRKPRVLIDKRLRQLQHLQRIEDN